MTSRLEQTKSLLLAALMLTSMIAGSVAFSGAVSAAQPTAVLEAYDDRQQIEENQQIREDVSILLQAGNSTDPEETQLTYNFTQTRGPSAELLTESNSPSEAIAILPDVSEPQIIEFQVEVSDGNSTDSDNIRLTVTPTPERYLNLSQSQPEYVVGAEVVLQGSISQEFDEAALYVKSDKFDTYELVELNGRPTFDLSGPDLENSSLSDGVRLAGNTQAPGNALLVQYGVYELAILNATKVSRDYRPVNDQSLPSSYVENNSEKTTTTIEVVPPRLNTSIEPANGQVSTSQNTVNISGYAPPSDEVLFIAVDSAGRVRPAIVNVRDNGRYDEEQIVLRTPNGSFAPGPASIHVLSTGRDGTIGDGKLPNNESAEYDQFAYYLDTLSGERDADALRELIYNETIQDNSPPNRGLNLSQNGSDDLLVNRSIEIVETENESVASDPVDVAPIDLEGSGTQSNPYQISNVSELQAMEDNLDANYELVSDIDASQTAQFNNGSGFDPVGTAAFGTTNEEFTGSLDGNGHTITGLTINRSDEGYTGLFGTLKSGIVTNVSLTQVTVIGDFSTGGLVGVAREDSTVQNVTVSGSVNGTFDVGGVAGAAKGSSTIQNVTASVDVTDDGGDGSAGGLVGGLEGNSVIKRATASGDVSGGSGVGGLVGQHRGSGTIQNSTAFGDVISSNRAAGGLVGENRQGTISNATASGNVSGNFNIGGLVGSNARTFTNDDAIIQNSVASGNVTGGANIGGLIGRNNNNGIINIAATSGSVSGTETVGGLVAVNNGTIQNATASSMVDGEFAVGGFVGDNRAGGTVQNATASGSVTAAGDDASRTGGLAGVSSGDIQNATAFSTVSASNVDEVGGLVGEHDSGTIRNAAAYGNVDGNRTVGGLVGRNDNGTIQQTFAVGSVNGSTDLGGLVGNNTGFSGTGTVTESYWDTEATNQRESTSNATGLTTAEMQGQAATTNISGLEFGTIWQTQPDDYPTLASQPNGSDTDFPATISIEHDPTSGSAQNTQFTTSEKLNIRPTGDTERIRFGDGAGRTFEIENSTGASVAIEPQTGEPIVEADSVEFDIYEGDGTLTDAPVVQLSPVDDDTDVVSVNVSVTGDTDMFAAGVATAPDDQSDPFDEYVVRILDEDNTIIGSTDSRLIGVGYNIGSGIEQNSTTGNITFTIPRESLNTGINHNWSAQFRIGSISDTEPGVGPVAVENTLGDDVFEFSVDTSTLPAGEYSYAFELYRVDREPAFDDFDDRVINIFGVDVVQVGEAEAPAPIDDKSSPTYVLEFAPSDARAGEQPYAFGVPGPTEQTLAEFFGDEPTTAQPAAAGDGVVYTLSTDGWTQVTATDELHGLQGYVLTDTDQSVQATAAIAQAEDGLAKPTQRELTAGSNFVTPTAQGAIQDELTFQLSDGEATQVQNPFAEPTISPGRETLFSSGNIAVGGEDVNPFAGYFLISDSGQYTSTINTGDEQTAANDGLNLEAAPDSANFTVTNVSSQNTNVTEGESLAVEITVENTGGVADTQDVSLRVNTDDLQDDYGDTSTSQFEFVNSTALTIESSAEQTVTLTYESVIGDAPEIDVLGGTEDDSAIERATLDAAPSPQFESATVEDGSPSEIVVRFDEDVNVTGGDTAFANDFFTLNPNENLTNSPSVAGELLTTEDGNVIVPLNGAIDASDNNTLTNVLFYNARSDTVVAQSDSRPVDAFRNENVANNVEESMTQPPTEGDSGDLAVSVEPGESGQQKNFTFEFNASNINDSTDLEEILVEFNGSSGVNASQIDDSAIRVETGGVEKASGENPSEAASGGLVFDLANTFTLQGVSGNVTVTISNTPVPNSGTFTGAVKFRGNDSTAASGTDEYTVSEPTQQQAELTIGGYSDQLPDRDTEPPTLENVDVTISEAANAEAENVSVLGEFKRTDRTGDSDTLTDTVTPQNGTIAAGGDETVTLFAGNESFEDLPDAEYEFSVTVTADNAADADRSERFTVAPTEANFNVSNITQLDDSATEGEAVNIEVVIENTGGAEGTQTITLSNTTGATEFDNESVMIGSGAREQVNLTYQSEIGDAGSVELQVNTENDSQDLVIVLNKALPETGTVSEAVTNLTDSSGIAGATVTIEQGGSMVETATTDRTVATASVSKLESTMCPLPLTG